MVTRVCSLCKIEKEEEQFPYRDKGRGIRKISCKACKSKTDARWHLKNREQVLIKQKNYKEPKRELLAKKQRDYYSKNRKERIDYERIKRQSDSRYRLMNNLRCGLNSSIKKKINGKYVKMTTLNVDELIQYLESKFLPGMSWDNRGVKGWHIDHIKPLSSFNLTNQSELMEAMHYSNLQPLWASDNYKKGRIERGGHCGKLEK